MQTLVMAGLLVFVAPGSTTQVFFGILVCFVFFAAQTKHNVFAGDQDNFLKQIAEAQLFLTLLITVMLRTDLAHETIGTDGYDMILAVLTFMVPLVLVVFSFKGKTAVPPPHSFVQYGSR